MRAFGFAGHDLFLRSQGGDPLPWWGCTLTMERLRQLVATHGNGFRPVEPLSRPLHLRVGCTNSVGVSAVAVGRAPADVAVASAARPVEVVLGLVARIRHRLPAVRAGRAARASRALERAGDPCAASRVVDPASAGGPAALRVTRPAAARGAQSDAAARFVAGIRGAAGNALA